MTNKQGSGSVRQVDTSTAGYMFILMLVSMIGPFANHVVVPSLPNLQEDFNTDFATVQLLVSVFMLGFGASQLFVGLLADAFGRRPLMLAGLALFGVASIACCFTTDIRMLVALRLIQGASGSVGIVLSRAIVRDTAIDGKTTGRLGWLAVGTSSAPLLAPSIGGLFYENFGWSGPFWLLTALSAAMFALALFTISETSTPHGQLKLGKLLSDIATLCRDRRFLLNCGNISFNTALFFTFVIGAAYISGHQLGLSPAVYGLWFMTAPIGYISANILVGKIYARFRPAKVLVVSSIGVLLCQAIIFTTFVLGEGSVFFLFLPTTIAQFFSGLILPISLTAVLAGNPDKAGSAAGLSGCLQFTMAALFSWIGGYLIEIDINYLLLILIGLGSCGLATAIGSARHMRGR